jgi:nucleoside-diphosphate-sugar epimerase
MSATKVLVTGGAGFVGAHLVNSQLQQGHTVRAVDLHLTGLDQIAHHPQLEIVQGDITDIRMVEKLVDGVDVVYHLASAHLDVTLPDSYYHQVNVEATQNLLVAARNAGVKRFVHCSSNGVLGEIKVLPADETTHCQPTNIYERTKLLGEQAARQFWRQTGFPVVVVRPGWVYGPGCHRTQKLIRMVSKGRFLMFGSGQTQRHPIFVSDAITGLELCARMETAVGQVYFIAGEKVVTISELVRTIAEVLRVRARIIHLPVALGLTAGYFCQAVFKPMKRQPPFSRRSIDFFLKDNAYDIAKARHDLNFQPQIDLRTGLQKTVEWQAANQHQPIAIKPL